MNRAVVGNHRLDDTFWCSQCRFLLSPRTKRSPANVDLMDAFGPRSGHRADPYIRYPKLNPCFDARLYWIFIGKREFVCRWATRGLGRRPASRKLLQLPPINGLSSRLIL